MRWLFTPHAIERLRERWRSCCSMSDTELERLLSPQLTEATKKNKGVKTPGGTYLPFTLMGQDGYAVLKDGELTTIMPAEWCEAVNKVRSEL